MLAGFICFMTITPKFYQFGAYDDIPLAGDWMGMIET